MVQNAKVISQTRACPKIARKAPKVLTKKEKQEQRPQVGIRIKYIMGQMYVVPREGVIQ